MPADSDRMHLAFATSRFYLFKSAVKACELTFRLAFFMDKGKMKSCRIT